MRRRPDPGVAWPRIIAHRCGGLLAPENSLAGLAAAARIGCRGVEFDAMLSADGVPVLMHDDTVDRTTGGHGVVSRLTLAELRRLDLGGEPVPLLADALARCAELGLWANIELKAGAGTDPARLGSVVGRLLAFAWRGPGVVSSFSDSALMAVRREVPDILRALLVEDLPLDWCDRARRTGATAVHLEAASATAAAVAAIRESGLIVACYTVNARLAAEALFALGVSAIFTDRPDLWPAAEM